MAQRRSARTAGTRGSSLKASLPAKCRVYDLVNYASEVATHHADSAGAWQLQAYIGKLIADEFDLEGTADGGADFDAFFVPQQAEVEA